MAQNSKIIFKLESLLNEFISSEEVNNEINKIGFSYYVYVRLTNEYPTVITNNKEEVISQFESLLIGSKCNTSEYLELQKQFGNKEEFRKALLSFIEDIEIISARPFDYRNVNNLMMLLTLDELKGLVNFDDESNIRSFSTPSSVSDLVIKLASLYNVDKGEKVTDVCCNKGSFLNRIGSNFKIVDGVELQENFVLIAKMRLAINSIEGEIRSNNCFYDTTYAKRDSDLVFSQFPWGLKEKDYVKQMVMMDCNRGKFNLNTRSNPDFFYMSTALNYLKRDSGVAMCIAPLSALLNLSDAPARESIIEKNLLDAVITLPNNIYPGTGISTAILIFSKCKKDHNVKLFDASTYVVKATRRLNAIDVDKLINEYKKACDNNECVYNICEIRKHEYSLLPAHYSNDLNKVVPNTITLEEISEIFTGWQVTSGKLESLHTTDGTGVKLLQMSNVEDGLIDKDLERYDAPEFTIKKFKVEEGDVVISTKSLNVKAAVVDVDTTDPIIASGSIMVIRPNRDLLDPYFLNAFFESDLGKEVIKLYQTGSVIPNLSIGNVRKMPIPKLSIEKQREIGAEYKELRDSIYSNKRRLENLKKKTKTLLDNLINEREN